MKKDKQIELDVNFGEFCHPSELSLNVPLFNSEEELVGKVDFYFDDSNCVKGKIKELSPEKIDINAVRTLKKSIEIGISGRIKEMDGNIVKDYVITGASIFFKQNAFKPKINEK